MRKFITLLLTILLLSQTTFVLAIEESDDLTKSITITQSRLVLSSKLKKDYSAYKYDIVNNSSQDINLVNAQLINGVDGNIASNAVDRGTGIGTTWAICGPLGLFTFGIGWAAGIVATPIVWGISSSGNKKARREGLAYSNIVNLGHLKKGDATSVQTLVPIGAQPQLKLTIQGTKSKDLVMVSR